MAKGTKKRYKVVDCGSLRLRSNPNTNASVITLIPVNEQVTLASAIGEDDEWAYVTYGDNTGWVMLKFIK